MIVALGSIFRNSSHYLDRYFAQANALRDALAVQGHSLRLILVEGDSTDDTWTALARHTERLDAVLVKRSHGGPRWGSVDLPDRWKALGWCCQGVSDHVTEDVGALVYVESDLTWEAETMLKLLGHLETKEAVAAMCFTSNGVFYDTWGHRKNGIPFGGLPPYHPELGEDLTPVDSAGSCFVLRGYVARKVKWGDECILSLGRSINEFFTLWLDPTAKVVQS